MGSIGDRNNQTVTTPTSCEKSTWRGFPSSWYRSHDLYELERRAIFSRHWLLITHKNRFSNNGDYIAFTTAGLSFFLCQDKHGQINGFHNICRHRGFPLMQKEVGNAKILACQYHGWSYGLGGKLAKAPYYQSFKDFDPSKNSLLPIHVHIDQLGFIWVNFDASKNPSAALAELPTGIDSQERHNGFDTSAYTLDHCWNYQGQYNWKLHGDNYNECYHCKTAHPDTKGLVDVDAYRVETDGAALFHLNRRQEEGRNSFTLATTYLWPSASVTVSPHFFYIMRLSPTSATTSNLQYEVYRHKDATDADFDHINQLFKRVLAEDRFLCTETQKNLSGGVYVNGSLHAQYESGSHDFQNLVRKAVKEHRAEEERQQRVIWPARQSTEGMEDTTLDDVAFCEGLSSCEMRSGRELQL